MKSILFFLLFIHSTDAFSQKIIISGEETTRKLTWSDFTGKVDESDPYSAYTNYNVKPHMDNIMLRGDSVFVGKIEVILELDPSKSWAKKDKLTDALLKHEQGHFDLGILCMRETLAMLGQSRFTKANLNSLAYDIINKMLKKYSDMSVLYDSDTNHSANKDEQKRWDKLIAEMLRKTQ